MEHLVDLSAEWLRAGFPDKRGRSWLAARGVSLIAQLQAPTEIAETRISVDGQFFVPDIGGRRVLLMAIWSCPPAEGGEIVDLVAFDHPVHASRRWRRTGLGAALGQHLAEPGWPLDGPVAVFRSPLAWARHGGVGVCLASPDPDECAALLRALPAIAAEDAAHAAELDGLLRRPIGRMPPIHV